VIVERSLHPDWLSCTYLVAPAADGPALLIDAGGPVAPLVRARERHRLDVVAALLTHHHHDHVAALDDLRAALGFERALAHPLEAARIDGVEALKPGRHELAGIAFSALHTPGHTDGMLAFVVDGAAFCGDTLFRGSVGGVRAPGASGYDDLRRSILEVLLALPPDTRLYPGHTDPTTVAEEREHNPFVRVWLGKDRPDGRRCRVAGEEAELVVLARDYDGGYKAWVRLGQERRDEIVPGSIVEIEA